MLLSKEHIVALMLGIVEPSCGLCSCAIYGPLIRRIARATVLADFLRTGPKSTEETKMGHW